MKLKAWLITCIFCLFTGGFCAAALLVPDREFSEVENRLLASAPSFSLNAFVDGDFTKDVETWLSDQFPLRDALTGLKSAADYAVGLREFNGVYLCGDRLISRVEPADTAKLDRDLGYINKLVANCGVPVYLGLIPSAAEVLRDELPTGAESADQTALIDYSYANTDAETVDIYSSLTAHRDESIYYRLDHHWTSLGAYYGYAALMGALGREALPLSDFTATRVSEDFRGTLYSSSGVHWLAPDSIETYVPDVGVSVTSYFTAEPSEGRLYYPDYLTKKDKYTYFLGGNQPLCLIENTEAPSGTLLVVRDSYMDSEAPFLSQSFSRVVLLDLRYYHGSVAAAAADYGADAVYVSYSVPNLLTDTNLVFLGQ